MTRDDQRRLDGKVALVTGAAQGNGRAIAIAFARQGARVLATDIQTDVLAETGRQGGDAVTVTKCDVLEAAQVESAVDRAVSEFGRLDVVCNSAGLIPMGKFSAPLIETTDELWDTMLNVNLRGTFYGIKYGMKAMIEGGWRGSIVNIGSTNCFTGERDSTAYVASKGGVLLLTKNAAAEAAEHGIRVNAVCPGATDTPGLRKYNETIGGALRAEALMRTFQPLTGIIPPEYIASAAAFLASDDSLGMTGTTMLVDGGALANWDHFSNE